MHLLCNTRQLLLERLLLDPQRIERFLQGTLHRADLRIDILDDRVVVRDIGSQTHLLDNQLIILVDRTRKRLILNTDIDRQDPDGIRLQDLGNGIQHFDLNLGSQQLILIVPHRLQRKSSLVGNIDGRVLAFEPLDGRIDITQLDGYGLQPLIDEVKGSPGRLPLGLHGILIIDGNQAIDHLGGLLRQIGVERYIDNIRHLLRLGNIQPSGIILSHITYRRHGNGHNLSFALRFNGHMLLEDAEYTNRRIPDRFSEGRLNHTNRFATRSRQTIL